MKKNYLLVLVMILLAFTSCKNKTTIIKSGKLLLEINKQMETKANSTVCKSIPLTKDFTASEYLVTNAFEAKQFNIESTNSSSVNDLHGKGVKTLITGLLEREGFKVTKTLSVTVYDSFPDMAFYKVSYINTGEKNLQVSKWVNHSYSVQSNNDKPAFWSFQSESSNKRADWIFPVDSTFSQKNFQGMNNTDYGGGIPVTDLWRREAGIAIGHVETVPKLVSLPVTKEEYSGNATISLEYSFPEVINFLPGDTISTYETFISVHTGDCFTTFHKYSKYVQESGVKFVADEPDAFEPVWCAWGYWQKFTMADIEGTLQKVKDLGIKWVDIDDGYQVTEGDWDVAPNRFPGGKSAMRNLSDKIHAMGLKAKIWWAPLAAGPEAKLLADNPDIILRKKDGDPQYITGWECYYLAPTYQKTINHTESLLKMYLHDWDFDGLKMDGMHINCILPDYNESHKLTNPEESCEKLPQYFKTVYDLARSYKPNVVVQNCPCGCVVSFFNLAFMNQAVASDPVTSWQTRSKGKVYKALRPGIAYYGDHVELSDGGLDFATQIGIGAVPGTKFTWPEGDFKLTSAKEQIMKKWISIYNREMISKGKFLGELYDIGYDKPETHVIQKGDTLYYAFYAKQWNNELTLKGLSAGKYKVVDYENDKDMGIIDSSNPQFKAAFEGHLLIKVYPSDK